MINEAFKEKLLGALKIAVDHVNTGCDNNQAVIKTAEQCDFNLEQTNRLCEVFNTARTIYHFENSTSEKNANFDLVNKDKVINTLFGNTDKSAYTVDTGFNIPDYSEYYGKELDFINGKQADYSDAVFNLNTSTTPDLEAQAYRITKIALSQRKLAEHGLNEARFAFETANQTTRKLASELTKDYLLNGNSKYARLIRCFDSKPNFEPVLENIKSAMPSYMYCSKEQLDSLGYVVEDRDLDAFKSDVLNIKQALELGSNLKALATEMSKESEATLDSFNSLIGNSTKLDPTNEFDDVFTDLFKSGATTTTTQEKVPNYTLQQILSGEEPEKATRTTVSSPASIAFSDVLSHSKNMGVNLPALYGTNEKDINAKIMARLKNQQREVLLQDLLVNDSFISDADPDTVGAIYAQIMQVAPEVSLNKEIVRAIIRNGIHNVNAVSPFDASAWVDLEKTIRETQGTLPKQKLQQGVR